MSPADRLAGLKRRVQSSMAMARLAASITPDTFVTFPGHAKSVELPQP